MALRVFFDSFSQPCRAVLMLLRANDIPFEKVLVNVGKGELLMDIAACHGWNI